MLIFVGIVFASLSIAYLTTNWLYQERIHTLIEDSLISNGKKLIQAYQTTSSTEMVPFMENFRGLTGTNLQIYDKSRKPLLKQGEEPIQANLDSIDQVIQGKIARNINTSKIPLVGLPFEVQGEPYALFITLQKNRIEVEFMNSIHTMYLLIFFLGSLLILIFARYLVNPIRRLTEATKHMAKGNFNLELQSGRKDEIGLLTTSFNEMALELSKLDRMRQEFVSSVSHEIQSPLTSIVGFTKALKQKKMNEESRLRYLTIIEEESERLSRLSQNLLQLSFLQQEHRPLHVKAYRLDEQLRRVAIALEPLWAAKDIEINLQLHAITIQADKDQLSQVWTNLLTNSIKFTPTRGAIIIEAIEKEHTIQVSITDNGIGIPQEERTEIFKPFHKVDKARNASVKGNGLGLSIVKQIIDIHHGKIEVSGLMGEGTTFTVSLPQTCERL